MRVVMVLLLALSGLQGCENAAELPANLQVCPETRPQVCPMSYKPVCGYHPDGSASTYSNSCGACSKADVVGFLPNACAE